jgi:hypothetical protein
VCRPARGVVGGDVPCELFLVLCSAWPMGWHGTGAAVVLFRANPAAAFQSRGRPRETPWCRGTHTYFPSLKYAIRLLILPLSSSLR